MTNSDDLANIDAAGHERTYHAFTRLALIAVLHAVAMLVVIAIWGLTDAGGWAAFSFILTIGATLIAFMTPERGWPWLAGTLVLLLVILAVL